VDKTPNQNWNEKIIEYRNKCQSILAVSKSFRFVGLINEYGRTLTGILRPGIRTLLSQESARNEFFLVSSLLNMRSKTSSNLGNLDHVIFRHDRIILIVFKRKEGIYYISSNQNAKFDDLGKSIVKIKELL
jgi:hypothetical protein